jgi:hypothetical protein
MDDDHGAWRGGVSGRGNGKGQFQRLCLPQADSDRGMVAGSRIGIDCNVGSQAARRPPSDLHAEQNLN